MNCVLTLGLVAAVGTSGSVWGESLTQTYVFENPDTTPVVFEGWSRSENADAYDYNLWMDVIYADGTPRWGVKRSFRQGTHDWEFARGIFRPEKPVAEVKLYAFLRKGTGKAEFRDVRLLRRAVSDRELVGRTYRTNRPYHDELVEEDDYLAGPDGRGPHHTLENRVARGDLGLHSPLPANEFRIWTEDSMSLVTPLTFPTNQLDQPDPICLALARGEAESAQIVVSTGRSCEWTDGFATAGQLKRADGRTFRGRVKWERVGYLARRNGYVVSKYSADERERWTPDPLLPAAPFVVRKDSSQGLWLTVTADRDALPGVYSGAVELNQAGRPAGSVRLKVKVLDFELPRTFGLKTAFSVMDGNTRAQYPDDFNRVRKQSWDIMLDHRLNPDDISRTTPPTLEDFKYARSRGMNLLNLLNLVVPSKDPNEKWVCVSKLEELDKPEFYDYVKSTLTPIWKELKKNGLEHSAYVYGFDERGKGYYPVIDRIWKRLQADFPGLPLMTTSGQYRDLAAGKRDPLLETTDWYCPLTRDYRLSLADELRAKGKEVWWYVCCTPKYPYVNFASTECPQMDGRLIGWSTYQSRADGLLYWHVNNWNSRQRTLDARETFFPEWDTDSGELHMPGDGILLYPTSDGIVSSVRLAQVRDGVEDYEWLRLAESVAGRKTVDDIVRTLVRCPYDATRSPAVLKKARWRLAKLISGSGKGCGCNPKRSVLTSR